MSGGVDSSVAAGLLVKAGHEVIGLSMQLYDQSDGSMRFGSCCTIDDLHDARRVAASLGIPHYIVNFERRFSETVVSDFVRELFDTYGVRIRLATINGENDWAANFIPDIQKTFVDKDPENNHYWFPSTGATVMLYVNTTKKPTTFQVTAHVGPADGSGAKARTKRIAAVQGNGSFRFDLGELEAGSPDGPCHVQVVALDS